METTKLMAAVFAAALTALTAQPVLADGWPSETVQIIVPTRAGGGTDLMTRIFADYMARASGGDVIVVNQPAGGGAVAAEQVYNADPDGHTLLFNHTGQIINYHTGRIDRPVTDLTTIGVAQSYPPQVYVVSADAPWTNMQEFVDDARANPGAYTVGVQLGGTSHFIAGLLQQNAEIELRPVEAAAEVDKVAGIQGGFLDIGNMAAGPARQYVESGDLRVLGMIDAPANPRYPEFVPLMDQGVNMTYLAPLVLWGPPGMDPELVEEINGLIAGMATDEIAQERLARADSGFRYYNVEEAEALVASENEQLRNLAERLGLAR